MLVGKLSREPKPPEVRASGVCDRPVSACNLESDRPFCAPHWPDPDNADPFNEWWLNTAEARLACGLWLLALWGHLLAWDLVWAGRLPTRGDGRSWAGAGFRAAERRGTLLLWAGFRLRLGVHPYGGRERMLPTIIISPNHILADIISMTQRSVRGVMLIDLNAVDAEYPPESWFPLPDFSAGYLPKPPLGNSP